MVEAVALRTCAECGEAKPEGEFIRRRGRGRVFVTRCVVCRTAMGLAEPPLSVTVRELEQQRRAERRVHLHLVHEFEAERPKTRGDCVDGVRPCPWASCKHNLYLDAARDTGTITFNHPGVELEDMDPERSCALDIADRGGATLDDVGLVMNVTRERIRQIEEKAQHRVRRYAAKRATPASTLLEYVDDGKTLDISLRPAGNGSIWRPDEARAEVDATAPDDDADEPPTRISFFAEGEQADELVAESIWQMAVRVYGIRSARSIRASKAMAKMRAEGRGPNWFGGAYALRDTPSGARISLSVARVAVFDAYFALAAELGRPPRAAEIFERLGKARAKSLGNVYQTLTHLRGRGLEMPLFKGKAAPRAESVPDGEATDQPRVGEAERVQTEETTMAYAETNELTPWLAAVLAAYKELSAGGATPATLDIAKKANATGATDKQRCSNVYAALGTLRKKGLLDGDRRRSKPTPGPKAPRPRRETPAPKPSAPASAGTASALEVLRTELAQVEQRAGALRDAITILEGVA